MLYNIDFCSSSCNGVFRYLLKMPRVWECITVMILVISPGTAAPPLIELCDSETCLRSAKRVQSLMNFQARPCENFYKYACGNYSKVKKLPPESDVMNMEEELLMEMKQNIIKFLQTWNDEEPTAVLKAKLFFESCTDIDALDDYGLLPLAVSLRSLNLPVKPPYIGPLENALPEFSIVIATVRRYIDLNFPFRIVVSVDRKNKLFNQLEIRAPVANVLSKMNQSIEPAKPSLRNSKKEMQGDVPETLNHSASPIHQRRNVGAPTRNIFASRGKSMVTGATQSKPNDEKRDTPPSNRVQKDTQLDPTNSKSTPVNPERDQKYENSKPLSRSLSADTAEQNASTKVEPTKPNDQDVKSDDENKPLAEYMAKVIDAMYKYTNNKLADNRVNFLWEKIADISQVLHSIEKLAINTISNGNGSGEFTVEELQKKTNLFAMHQTGKPVINWSELIATLYYDNDTVKKQFESGELKVFVEDMDYLQHAIKFLAEVNERSLYSALWWTVVRHYIVDTTEEARTWDEEYRRSVGLKVESRDEHCMKATVDLFDFAAAYNYVQDASISRGINMMHSLIIPNLNKAVRQYIKTLPDFDTKTRMAALHKFTNIVFRPGYYPRLRSPNYLNWVYRTTIQIRGSYYFSRMVYERRSIMASLRRISMQNDDLPPRFLSPLASKMEFSVQDNTIYFPVALFKFPASEHPLAALNFGTLATAAARAIYQAIHFTGSEYNAFGYRTNWWEPVAVQNYSNRIEFIASECSKVFNEKFNEHVNGPAVVSSVIADVLSFDLATFAYNIAVFSDSLKDPKLIKFEHFSPIKLLTLTWAQSICESETDERLFNTIKKGSSLPAADRIRETVKYSVNFSEIWRCK